MPPTDRPDPAAPPAPGRRLVAAVTCAGVLVLAWWMRAAPLGPGTLWLDDLWVVAPSHADGVGDAARMLVTTPGFTVLVNAVHVVGGRTATAAQALPFLAGLLGPLVALAAARSMRWSWSAALVAAVVVAVAPEHAVHSTRVKQYTLEAVLGFAAVALGWRLLRRGASPWPLVALAAGATVVSASAGVYAGAVLGAVTLLQLLDRGSGGPVRGPEGRDDPSVGRVLAPAAAFGGFALVWWAGYLRTHVPEGLRDYWEDDFLDTGDLLGDLGASLDRMAAGFLPLPLAWVWLAAAALAVVVTAPRLALVLATPIAAAIVLAGLELAPLGTGRTDIHLLPSAALAAGAAVEGLRRRAPRSDLLVAGAVAVALVAAVVVRDVRPTSYPAFDVRPLIEEAEASDAGRIVVYPATRWAWAIHGERGFEPVDAANETGFDVRIRDPRVAVLGPHRDDPARYGSELEQATAGVDRVVFVASHWREDVLAVEGWFGADRWQEVRREERPGARLVEWRRAP